MSTDLITDWEFECTCGFSFKLPIVADDSAGEYALNIAMTHIMECEDE